MPEIGRVRAFIAGLGVLVAASAAQAAPPRCLVPSGAGAPTCRAASKPAPEAPARPSDLAGAYGVYRAVGGAMPVRRCRLSPTCSLFAVRAIRAFGVRGVLMTLARLQMEHGDQGGLLAASLASDGGFVYADPVTLWLP